MRRDISSDALLSHSHLTKFPLVLGRLDSHSLTSPARPLFLHKRCLSHIVHRRCLSLLARLPPSSSFPALANPFTKLACSTLLHLSLLPLADLLKNRLLSSLLISLKRHVSTISCFVSFFCGNPCLILAGQPSHHESPIFCALLHQ